ncbi:MAG TPA: alpha/beta hydrolase, partial [Nitrososphaeraceae archaeon]|nr:alpha/beta hydrolase [Nitrososphaeraceae archaeon]
KRISILYVHFRLIPGSSTLNSIQQLGLATNVHGITVPNSGHFIPEERPEFVIEQLFKFFGGNNTN